MKKRFWAIVLCGIFSICFGMSFTAVQNLFCVSNAEEIPFYQQVYELNRDLGFIYLDKDVDLQTLQKQLSLDVLEGANTPLDQSKLTYSQLEDICQQNDFIIDETPDGYAVRNLYSLKTLVVDGEVENSYNAIKVITGYRDFTVLYYQSEQATKNAYNSLLQDGEEVSIDWVLSIEDVSFEPVANLQTSAYYDSYHTWGAEAMDLQYYNNYLNSNNCGKEVVVAVLDSGINTSHELLKDRILKDSSGKMLGETLYTTKYKYSGYSFEDDDGHGSHVAGIITQLTPNNVKILPIKIANNEGNLTTLDVISGLEIVEDYILDGYNIVCGNLSVGGYIADQSSLEYWRNETADIVEDLREKYNFISIVAAGNEDTDATNVVPASVEKAITVSALKKIDSGLYEFDDEYSNYGAYIDISAPGSDIKSAYINTSSPNVASARAYAISSGTSMAAPHVAAAVALFCIDKNYYSENSAQYSVADIETRLFQSCVDLGSPKRDNYYGHGMVNLKNAQNVISYTVEDCVTTYDGQPHNIKITVTNATSYTITYGLVSGRYNITDISTNSTFKNYTSGAISVYFKITAMGYIPVEGVGKLTINSAPITINVKDQTFSYGDIDFNENAYTITSGAILEQDKEAFNLSTTAVSNSGVGDYAITMTCSSKNYSLTANSAKLHVTKRDVSIALSSKSVVYGNAISLNDITYSVTSGSIVAGDSLGLRLTTNATSTSGKGDYKISMASYSNGNYNVTATDGKLTITQRAITITLKNQTLQYDASYTIDSSINSAYTVTAGSIVGKDNLGVLIASRENIHGIGNYNLYLKSYSNSNYKVSCSADATLTVTKRKLQAEIENQTFVYGNQITFDNTKYAITGGIIGGDSLSEKITFSANGVRNVGNYPISFTYSNANYDIEIIQGYVVIAPREITLSVGNYEFTYGEVDFSEIEYVVTDGNILAGDSVNFSVVSDHITNQTGQGTYVLRGQSSNANYSITIQNGQVKINPRNISITTTQTSVYGDEVKFDKQNYQLLSGSVINDDDLQIEFKTTASKMSVVGDYDLEIESCNDNYNITLKNSKLSISKRPLKIALRKQESEYGSEPIVKHDAFVVKSDLPSFETIENLLIELSASVTVQSSIGKYEITATCSNGNYDFSYTAGYYKITPRKLVIKLHDQKIAYSSGIKLDMNAYEIVKGSILQGEEANITIYSTSNKYSALGGGYVLTASCDNSNYTLIVYSSVLQVEADLSYILIIVCVPAGAFIIVIALICIFGRKRKKV